MKAVTTRKENTALNVLPSLFGRVPNRTWTQLTIAVDRRKGQAEEHEATDHNNFPSSIGNCRRGHNTPRIETAETETPMSEDASNCHQGIGMGR